MIVAVIRGNVRPSAGEDNASFSDEASPVVGLTVCFDKFKGAPNDPSFPGGRSCSQVLLLRRVQDCSEEGAGWRPGEVSEVSIDVRSSGGRAISLGKGGTVEQPGIKSFIGAVAAGGL